MLHIPSLQGHPVVQSCASYITLSESSLYLRDSIRIMLSQFVLINVALHLWRMLAFVPPRAVMVLMYTLLTSSLITGGALDIIYAITGFKTFCGNSMVQLDALLFVLTVCLPESDALLDQLYMEYN
jgi:hypothetical protein